MADMWTGGLLVTIVVTAVTATTRPIIGVLSQEVIGDFKNRTAYIPASYVKAIEASGARVVPIYIGRPKEYYEDIMSKINGVMYPGGDANFTDPRGYGEAGRHIYDIARKLNDEGDHFPIMGVCLGYEMFMFMAGGDYGVLTTCNSEIPQPLRFQDEFNYSRLYKQIPADILNILSTLPVTANHHQYCVTRDLLKAYKLEKEWRVLTTSVDQNGLEFISSSESIQYPFVGLQFHPEKCTYEWNSGQKNPHSRKAVYSARYFYDWVVNDARRNNHTFPSDQEEKDTLIYNYNPVYLGKDDGYNEQVYYFSV